MDYDTTATPILTCRDLTVGYKDKAVLSGLNLDFETGQFISLLGPNGAGKTTLLRTLSRHLDPLDRPYRDRGPAAAPDECHGTGHRLWPWC